MSASSVVYLCLLRLDAVNGWRPVTHFLLGLALLFALYFAAFRVVARWPNNKSGAWQSVAAGAVLFRLLLLPAGLPAAAAPSAKLALLKQDLTSQAVVFERYQLFDNDVWRYLWDGHVSASAVNPYRFAPSDPAMDALETSSLWSDVRENVSYPDVRTIYPPLAQAIFLLSAWIAPGSVIAIKALLSGFDLAAGLLLGLTLQALGRNPAWAILYAWNPLVVKVFAGSGHIDAVVVAFLTAMAYSLQKAAPAWAAVSLALAILAKLSPAILLFFLWRKVGAARTALVAAIVLLGYLPFLSAGTAVFGGLHTFATDWQFNSGIYPVVRYLARPFFTDPSQAAKLICGLILAAILALLWRRPSGKTMAEQAAPAFGWLLLLSPAVMPWYTTWALPFAILSRQRIWIIWTALSCLAFLVMVDGRERAVVLALEYLGLAVAWLITSNLNQVEL